MEEEGRENEKQHSFVEAIKKKYEEGHVEEEDSFCQIYVPKNAPGAQAEDKGDYQVPSRLAVDNCGITEAGPGEEIESLCSRVQELDMAKNGLTDWLQVFQIIQHIPMLHFLNLSFNPLDNTTIPTDLSKTFEGITVLILNGTGISWRDVEKVLACFSSLTELHLSLNNYISVDLSAETCHRSMSKLFINSCKLSQWSDMTKLGRCFPSLQVLNVIKSDIKSLDEENIVDAFPVLKNLNISGNPIASWEEIDKFRKFPALENLRIKDVPFLEELPEKERRQHLVARLPNIKCLNGSRIGEVEREDAERAFIRAFMTKDVRPSRYDELEAIHGKLDPLAKVDLSPKNFVQVVVKFEEKVQLMEIDKRQTVLDFKKLLQNFTGLHPLKFRLMHVENFEGKYRDTNEMKFPNKALFSMNIREGDEILIYRKE